MSSTSPMLLLVLSIINFFLAACAAPSSRNDSAEDQILEERAREYFDERFRFYPVEATAAGLHAYDGELGQFGASQVALRILQLRDLRQRLLGIDLTGLSRAAFVDALWLTSSVKAELFELEEIEAWRRSPLFYSDILCQGVTSLLEPWGAPRVEALLSRLDQVPILLQAGVENLEGPSPLALEEGIAEFQRCQQIIADLPGALAGFSNDARVGELQRATLDTVERIRGFIAHLENNVTPGGPDSFRWGEEKLRVQLLYREMEETPLRAIRLIAERHLSDTTERAKKLAASVDASATTSAETDGRAAASLTAHRETEPGEALVSATEEFLEMLRQLTSEAEMTAPAPEAPIPRVKVSRFVPPHAIALLETPGPLDPSGEAVFLLAPPPPVNPGGPVVPYEIQVRAMREVYPGKYFRLLVGRGQPGHSDLRRLLISRANREGWSHYAEAALLDQEGAGMDPRLRLAVLHRMVVEQTRLVTAILLHAGDLSLATATRMFVNEAFLDPAAAEREARRVAVDPSGMSAALGKLQIMKLRRDFIEAERNSVTSGEFHQAFFSCGELPLRLVRLLLLPSGEGQTLED